MNFPVYQDWVLGPPVYFFGLHSNHKDALKKAWGKQDFCVAYEYRHWVWVKELKYCKMWVMSGNQGTAFEISDIISSKDADEEIIVFIKVFYKELRVENEIKNKDPVA